ncbi:MAG: hypothetical protein ACT4PT_12775 [Methanobacteriota archaeon]
MARFGTDLVYAFAGVLGGAVYVLYAGPTWLAAVNETFGLGNDGPVIYLVVAGLFGLLYGEIVRAMKPARGMQPALGLVYGVLLWVIGALIAIPAIRGGTLFDWRAAGGGIWGHLLYAAILVAVGRLLTAGPDERKAETIPTV